MVVMPNKQEYLMPTSEMKNLLSGVFRTSVSYWSSMIVRVRTYVFVSGGLGHGEYDTVVVAIVACGSGF